MKLSPAQLQGLANQSLRQGWSTNQTQAAIGQRAKSSAKSGGGKAAQKAAPKSAAKAVKAGK